MDNHKIRVKCPYCSNATVRKSDGEIALQKIGKAIKTVLDIFTTVKGTNPNISNLSNVFVSDDEIGEIVGTECYCETCKHTFNLKSWYDSIHSKSVIICDAEDAPENIRKREIQRTGKYGVMILSGEKGMFASPSYLDAIHDIAEVFEDDIRKLTKNFPFIVRFSTREKRDEFVNYIAQKKDCTYKTIDFDMKKKIREDGMSLEQIQNKFGDLFGS